MATIILKNPVVGQMGTVGFPPYQFEQTAQVNLVWWRVSGVTRDNNGNPLGGCLVKLFNTQTDVKMGSMVSDGSGNYSFLIQAPSNTTFYTVNYLTGSPDVAGTSVNTLVEQP